MIGRCAAILGLLRTRSNSEAVQRVLQPMAVRVHAPLATLGAGLSVQSELEGRQDDRKTFCRSVSRLQIDRSRPLKPLHSRPSRTTNDSHSPKLAPLMP